jgi:hypothetical protein
MLALGAAAGAGIVLALRAAGSPQPPAEADPYTALFGREEAR